MGPNTVRRSTPRLPAVTYWRRRFLALVVGMAVLALLAWAFSGALGASRAASDTPPHNPAHHALADGSTTTPAAKPTDTPAKQPTNSASHKPSAHKSPKPSASTTRASRPPARHKKTPAKGGLQPCPAGTVVLSLFSSQGSYSTGQTPQFQIDVVSTGTDACTFDIGARHVVLQISQGKDLIWTSAQCAEGTASLIVTLHRGVPTIVPMTWDGRRSSAGCPVPGAAASKGSYTAQAVDGSLRSNSIAFRLT
jgi:ABC-type nickel/cobalt efflux system permease component RcnA